MVTVGHMVMVGHMVTVGQAVTVGHGVNVGYGVGSRSPYVGCGLVGRLVGLGVGGGPPFATTAVSAV